MIIGSNCTKIEIYTNLFTIDNIIWIILRSYTFYLIYIIAYLISCIIIWCNASISHIASEYYNKIQIRKLQFCWYWIGTYVRICVCAYVCMYVRMCVSMYVCMHVCVCVRMFVCMYVRVYVCTYVRMYVCVYVCMYVRMCFVQRLDDVLPSSSSHSHLPSFPPPLTPSSSHDCIYLFSPVRKSARFLQHDTVCSIWRLRPSNRWLMRVRVSSHVHTIIYIHTYTHTHTPIHTYRSKWDLNIFFKLLILESTYMY